MRHELTVPFAGTLNYSIKAIDRNTSLLPGTFQNRAAAFRVFHDAYLITGNFVDHEWSLKLSLFECMVWTSVGMLTHREDKMGVGAVKQL